MPAALDITGMRFGRLIAIHRTGHGSRWHCQCNCGNTTEVSAGQLRAANTRSCGCLRRELNAIKGRESAEARTNHGHARAGDVSKTYVSWISMKDRCNNPNYMAWVEEAQTLSAKSLELLRPTIRKDRSELWFSWNPRHRTDPVDLFFRKHPHPDAVSVLVNWRDNPWFPEELRKEMEFDDEGPLQ